MRKLEFTVPAEYDGRLIKNFLRGYCHLSARLMVKLKHTPLGILQNGRHAKVIEILHTGDKLTLCLPEDESCMEAVLTPLTVLYEDDDLLAIDKPADMPIYPSPGHDCDSLGNAVTAYLVAQGVHTAFRPIYRLDKDTTGIMLLAKNAYVAAALAHNIEKEYVAICEGSLTGSGVIDQPLGLKEGHHIQRAVTPDGERAVTHYRVIATSPTHSYVSFHLETGRTHQIRVHMAFLEHPLAGDDFYGGSVELIARQALHCASAAWIHPVTKVPISLKSPLPVDFQRLAAKANLEI